MKILVNLVWPGRMHLRCHLFIFFFYKHYTMSTAFRPMFTDIALRLWHRTNEIKLCVPLNTTCALASVTVGRSSSHKPEPCDKCGSRYTSSTKPCGTRHFGEILHIKIDHGTSEYKVKQPEKKNASTYLIHLN